MQAVRFPREFELPWEVAIMCEEYDRLIIEPARPKSLRAIPATLAPLNEDFSPIDDPPLVPPNFDALPSRHKQ
jgi:antitoxin VapB